MSSQSIARSRTLFKKALHMVPEIAVHPQLVPLGMRGVHIATYLSLRPQWIRNAGIATVLDIGANTGQFASAIHEVLPDARIYSFEPLPDCFPLLERRIAVIPHAVAFNVAIGDESSKITFYRNHFSKASSALAMADAHREAFPWTAEETPIQVDVRPLDNFLSQLELEKHVLVKIDVQGFEDRVLRGGEQVLRQADYVFVETSFMPLYEGQASFETVYEQMQNFGFRFAGMMDQLANPGDGRILQADAIFIRQSVGQ